MDFYIFHMHKNIGGIIKTPTITFTMAVTSIKLSR